MIDLKKGRLAKRLLHGLAFSMSCAAVVACGGSGGADDGDGSISAKAEDDELICILSVDCPSGQHCDLGECIQSCNTEDPCSQESRSCSPRGRCLAEGVEDKDPAPAVKTFGSLSVDQNLIQLTEKDESFEIKLRSSARAAIRYRVTTRSDFISIEERRGQFEDETTLTFNIDQAKYDPEAGGQTIKIFSDLGEQVVQVVMNAGLTGKYQGALRYSSNGINLGDARVAVEVIDRGGDLDVLFDPDVSLLFPEDSDGPTTGFGSVGEDAVSASFTVNQRLSAEFAGDRNFFDRELGRRLLVDLTKNRTGGLEGTFREKIYGVFEQPIELEGSIVLERRPEESRPDFELTSDGQMPDLEVPVRDYSSLFGAASSMKDCSEAMAVVNANWDQSQAALETALDRAYLSYYRLENTMATRVASGVSYTDLLGTCEGELQSPDEPALIDCAWHPALACGLLYSGPVPYDGSDPDDIKTLHDPEGFNRLFAATVSPTLLVAQDYAVQAFEHSLVSGGLPKEREAYTQATEAIAPVLNWVLHPDVLTYMASLTGEQARGTEPVDDDSTSAQTFPAGRALSQLMKIMGVVEGERSRIQTIDLVESPGELVTEAQERAVLGLLEAAVLMEITKQWGVSPDVISADLSGYLSPMDSGFAALIEGARAFGIPDGFVPFVWRSSDVGQGATNFEQMLALTADPRDSQKALEVSYLANGRAYEQSENELRREAQNIKLTYDTQVQDICGAAFDLEGATTPEAWESCGAGDQGEFGALLLDVAMADQRLASSESRLLGMRDKLEIDQRVLAEKQSLRVDTMQFIDESNLQISALTVAESAIDTAMESIAVASNSSALNGGAPAGMAVGVAVLGIIKGGILQGKMALQNAQEMRVMQQNADIEYIDGMANLQKQVIDINQLSLEMMEEALAKQQVVGRAATLLEKARTLHDLRKGAIAIAGKDPVHDPSYRLLRDEQALKLLDARARVQRSLYLSARALEYEVNEPIGGITGAVLSARSSLAMQQLSNCFSEIYSSYRLAYGTPQDYSTEVSVREMLGIMGSRKDEVTGQELSAGEQFRLLTQKNSTFDEDGALHIEFSTSLQEGNGLWSSDVCSDRISGVQVQLVGDRMGDNEAQVNFSLTGSAFVGQCGSEGTEVWTMAETSSGGAGVAVVQAGVNSFGDTTANSSLFGQSVARSSWVLTIPPGSIAPSNEDLDLTQLEDILIKVEHTALPRRSTAVKVDTSCLMSIQ